MSYVGTVYVRCVTYGRGVKDRRALRRALDAYDRLEVAGWCGALLLLPENARQAARILALAGAALERGTSSGGKRIGRRELTRWFQDSPSLHTGVAWDPHEGPFCEPVSFTGGGYRLLTGGSEAGMIFDLRCVLRAMFQTDWPSEHKALIRQAHQTARAVLELATYACDVAGTERWASAGGEGPVAVPEGDVLNALCHATMFSSYELATILPVEVEALDPIIWDLDESGVPPSTPEGTQFDARPLLKSGDRYALVDPGSLARALKHALISTVVGNGLLDDFLVRVRYTAVQEALDASVQMGWRPDNDLWVRAEDAPIDSFGVRFDTDKVANVVVVRDVLSGYDPADPYTSWNTEEIQPALARHIRRVEQQLVYETERPPNEILHVVLFAGYGRAAVMGMPDVEQPLKPMTLLLTLENFVRIATGDAGPVTLWDFARASARVREQTNVFSFAGIDEFGLWSEGESYYLSDDRRPTLLMVDTDYGKKLRESVARKWDIHGAVLPVGAWTDIVRVDGDSDIPIYGLVNGNAGLVARAVETGSVVVWVSAVPETSERPEPREPFANMVDCVAYWVWQFMPVLEARLEQIGTDHVAIDVDLVEPEAWTRSHDAPVTATGPIVQVEASDNGMRLTVFPGMIEQLMSPDNHAERALVRELLRGFDCLVRTGHRLGEQGIDEAVERFAPLGPKRMISFFWTGNDTALVPGDLPDLLRNSEADRDELLDDEGEHLRSTHGLAVGRFAPQDRTVVLNDAVDFHFGQLEREVATLSSEGLLETLISHHEASLHRLALRRRKVGARRAAYGEEKLVADEIEATPQESHAAVALRFLIEYVAAQPPSGLRPLSRATLNRIHARAGLIVSRGLTSDLIRRGIEDTELGFLESGRISLPAGRYQAGSEAFLADAVPAQIRAAIAKRSDSSGESGASNDRDAEADVEEMGRAAQAEWGFTLLEILAFLQGLHDIALDETTVVASMPCGDLEAALAAELEWPEDRVREVLDLHLLRPRQSYQDVPSGFEGFDIWPWRFNRKLSYLRRPVVLRPTVAGDEYVWGVRHPVESGRYVCDLIEDDRLDARSPEMKNLMTRLSQRSALEFVDNVASIACDLGMAVDTNVKKIGGQQITRSNGQDLGDIDVLVADVTSKKIYALECKALAGARTPAELGNELKKTFGSGGKKPSAAEKHKERSEWLTARLPEALLHLKLPDEDAQGWTVVSAMVTDAHVLAPRIADCPLPVYAQADLQEFLLSGMSAATDVAA